MSVEDEIARTKRRLAELEKQIAASKEDSDSDIECIALYSGVLKSGKQSNSKWIVDSAATNHMCCDRNDMQEIKRLDNPKNVKVGNGEYVKAKFKGSVKLLVKSSSNGTRKVKLHEVLLVPKLKYNLFSVSKVAQLGKKVEFNQSGCKIIDNSSGETIVCAAKVGELYHLDCTYSREKDQRSKMNVPARRGMETALLSVKENNFKHEMMRRLSSIDSDKIKIATR